MILKIYYLLIKMERLNKNFLLSECLILEFIYCKKIQVCHSEFYKFIFNIKEKI